MGTRADGAIHLLNFPSRVNEITDTFGVACVGVVTCPIGQTHCAVPVTQERERKIELLGEGSITLYRIKAHTDNFNILSLEVCKLVAEPATFGGSTGCICLGVEPQQDLFS